MARHVFTPDAVGWTVRVGRPRFLGGGGDLTVGHGEDEGGFGPLLVGAALLLVLLLTPVWIASGRWWVLLLVPVLLAGAWARFARYPVELRRDGAATPLHRTVVAGRRQARRVADELAAEIERTPDDLLG